MQNQTVVERRKHEKLASMLRFAWQYCLFIVWAVWWGGLCFYAIVVMPIGTEAYPSSSRTLWTIGASLLLLDIGLVGWHYHLSNMMDFKN